MENKYNSGGEYSGRAPEANSGAVLMAALLLSLVLARFYSYLLFHSLVEVFTIAVAWSIFFLAWNARRFLENHYLLFVGIASLFVGLIDSVHMLAYKGMAVFPQHNANLPTQVWIAGRYIQSLSFLAAPLFLRRKLKPGLTVGIYTAIVLVVMDSILHLDVFPACYVEGAGLTPFKVISEYIVSLILLGSILLLLKYRSQFDGTVFKWLAGAIALTMAGELAFTLYVDVYGPANVIGHLLRFLAFCFLYRAIIVTGLIRPYDLLFRNLAQSEEALRTANKKLEVTVAALRRNQERYRAFVGNSSEGIFRVEVRQPVPVSLPEDEQIRLFFENAHIAECNDAYARMHGRGKADDVIGARLQEVLPHSEPCSADLVSTFVRSGYRIVDTEFCETAPDGGLQCISGSLTGVVENGCIVRAWGVQRDITERKRAAMERERLISDLQQALAEVKRLSGLLPICANCKKIRDDKGYWTQVESYVGQRADVSFSHGICPDCMNTLYPEYQRDDSI